MSTKQFNDLPSGSMSDNLLGVITDPLSGQLFEVGQKQAKDYYSAGSVPTASYLVDSASFYSNILNVFASESNYASTSSFNTLSSSYHLDSASFNTRINNVTSSGGGGTLSGSGNTNYIPFYSSSFGFTSSIIQQNNGAIGIGIIPSASLDVAGNIRQNSNSDLVLKRNTSNIFNGISFQNQGGGELGAVRLQDNTGEFRIGATNAGGYYTTIYSSNVEDLKIDTSHNINTKNILPYTAKTYNLGASNLGWNNVFISGSVYDSVGSSGSLNQVLSSTANGIQWVNPTSSIVIASGSVFLNLLSGSLNISGSATFIGIQANGTDQTAKINQALSGSFPALVIDLPYGSAITINGTVNLGNKGIYFYPGNKFTSTGSIVGGIWDAPFDSQILDTTVFAAPSATKNHVWSAAWYGMVQNSGDSQPAIQKSVDIAVASAGLIKTVELPAGNYYIFSPIIICSWNGSQYTAVPSIELRGQGEFWQSSSGGTLLTMNNAGANAASCFAIGIQIGKGVKISHMKLKGIFQPPFQSGGYNFFTSSFNSFTDGVCRDQPNSPYSAICIDPFSSALPGDGGYLLSGSNNSIYGPSGTGSWYRGTQGDGGSTGCTFEDLFITNFVMGFIFSPSGLTSNAELMFLNRIQGFAMKCFIQSCQAQEKMNLLDYWAVWGQTHTIFNSGKGGGAGYGSVEPGHWVLRHGNIAGAVVRLVNRASSGFFPLKIYDVYAESLGTVGEWDGAMVDSMENCIFDFNDLSVYSAFPPCHLSGSNLTVKNCHFRYYGHPENRIILVGNNFYDCQFNDVPIGGNSFVDCQIPGITNRAILNPASDIQSQASGFTDYIAFGKYKLTDANQATQNKIISYNFSQDNGAIQYLQVDPINQAGQIVSMSFSGTQNTAIVTFPTGSVSGSMLARLSVNDTILGIGSLSLVTSVGTSSFSLGYIMNGATTGIYNLSIAKTVYAIGFIGSTVAGSNLITSCSIDKGSFANLINRGGYLAIPGFYQFRENSLGAKALNWDGISTLTMDRPASETLTNFYFSNNLSQKTIVVQNDYVGAGNPISNNEIFPKGGKYTDFANYFAPSSNGGRNERTITQTGFYNQAPFAVYTDTTATKYYSGTFTGSATMSISQFDLLTNVAINPSSTLPSFSIGLSTSGSEILSQVVASGSVYTAYQLGFIANSNPTTIYLNGLTGATSSITIYKQST